MIPGREDPPAAAEPPRAEDLVELAIWRDGTVTAALRQLALGGTVLLDERAEPPLRVCFGRLLAAATEADFAVARIRLAGVDLGGNELFGLRACRLLLGRLDVDTLADAGQEALGHPERRASLQRLLQFVGSGRIRIHAAGVQAWSPDFSVLRGVAGLGRADGSAVVVLGPHHFARTHGLSGPAITALLPGEAPARLATGRFDEMFERGYDVTSVVGDVLAELLGGLASGSRGALGGLTGLGRTKTP